MQTSSPIHYRALRDEEAGLLNEFLYEAIYVPEGTEKLPRSVLDLPELAKYVSHWGSDPYDAAIVAVEGSECIGAIWGRRFSEQNPGYGFVDAHTPEISMAVLPAYRNRGIGSRLLEELEQAYRKLGVKALSLSVDQQNPARRLYERQGYRYHEEVETAVTLRKEL